MFKNFSHEHQKKYLKANLHKHSYNNNIGKKNHQGEVQYLTYRISYCVSSNTYNIHFQQLEMGLLIW